MRENTDQRNFEYGHFSRSDAIPHKLSVTNSVDSVDICKIEVLFGATGLTWLESGIPCESSISCSDERILITI